MFNFPDWIQCDSKMKYFCSPFSQSSLRSRRQKGYGPGGYFGEFLVGGVMPGSPNPDPISDQKLSFSTLVFRPDVSRNYVIIT